MANIKIWCDGASKGNPGVGGWGAILQDDKGRQKEIYGGEPVATNNQMELTALIKAVECLKNPGCIITVYSDSKYVVEGTNRWLAGWKAKGWRASAGALKNVELWKKLDELMDKHTVTCVWVKGHCGDPMNERADALANMGCYGSSEK